MSGELASQLGSSDPAPTSTTTAAGTTTGTGLPASVPATETATAPLAESPMLNIASLKADSLLSLASTTHEVSPGAPAAAQPTSIEAQPSMIATAASIEPSPAAEAAASVAPVVTAADIPAEGTTSTTAEAVSAPSEPIVSATVEAITDAAIPQPPVSDLRTEVEAEAPPAEIVSASEADPSTVTAPVEANASEHPLGNGTIATSQISTVEEPLVNGHGHTNDTADHSSQPTCTAPPAEVVSSLPEAPIVPPAPLSAPETVPPPPVVPLPAVTEFLQMPQMRRAESTNSSIAAQPATPVTSTGTVPPPLPSSAAVNSPAPAPVPAVTSANASYDAFVHEQFGFDPTAAAPAMSTAPEPVQTESTPSEPSAPAPAPAPVINRDLTPAPAPTPACEPASAIAPAPTPVNVELPLSGDGFAPPPPASAPIQSTPAASSEDVQMADSLASAGESPLLKRSFSDDAPAVAAGVVGEVSQERDAKRFKSDEAASTPATAPAPAPATTSAPSSLAPPAAAEAARVPSPTPQPVLGYDPSAFTHVASLPHSVVSQASAHNSSTAPAPTHSHQPQIATSSASSQPTPPAPVPSSSGYAQSPAPELPPSATATGPLPIMTKEQQKWALTMIRSLKKNKSAGPFCRPVDPVALLIPDYFRVITRPMDLGTIETKLNATGKAMAAASKLGRTFGIDYTRGAGAWEGASDKVYRTAEEFKEDVMRVWDNCYRYNGPADKNPVSGMAAVLQAICERQWKTMPSAPLIEHVEPPAPPRPAVPQPVAVSLIDGGSSKKDRRPSQSFVPTIRRSEDGTRPKREIHAPTRELPYLVDAAEQQQQQVAAAPSRSRTGRVSGKMAQEQLRFCKEVIKEMFKKVHEPYAYVFYEPVNYVALNIPQYPQVIKKPMDLGTVRNKLEQGLYNANPYSAFEADMRLIFKNCYTFNPVGSPVNEWGHRVEQIFEQKWNERPMAPVDDEDEVSEDDGISAMEKQLQMMQANLELMKQQKRAEKEQARMMAAMQEMQAGFTRAPKPSKKQSTQDRRASAGAAPKKARSSSTGGPAAAPSAAGATKKKRSKHREEGPGYGAPSPPPAQPESVTFEMKRELAVKIVSFEGENLERAIDIIRRGRPDLLSDANKEIELDIDQLDQRTLLNLYRFVCPPALKPKQARRANGASAAPSKRKLLDEDKEAERIEALEKRLLDFQKGSTAGGNTALHDVASSESSSDDESGSDSDED